MFGKKLESSQLAVSPMEELEKSVYVLMMCVLELIILGAVQHGFILLAYEE